jgi:hypothetical protein
MTPISRAIAIVFVVANATAGGHIAVVGILGIKA